MKENPIIVPVQLNQSSSDQPYTDTPSCYFKINGAEATFYNGVDKHILHAVLAEMSKHARYFLECSKHIYRLWSHRYALWH